MTVGIWVLLAALVAAAVIGAGLRARAGTVREVAAGPAGTGRDTATATGSPTPAEAADETVALLRAAGVRPGRVTIVRFTAPWCGRCPAVARAADTARTRLPDPESVDDLALDLAGHDDLARLLSVRALPTTFLVDARTAVRHRIADAPAPRELAATLTALLDENAPGTRTAL